jgi:hypothetical protein
MDLKIVHHVKFMINSSQKEANTAHQWSAWQKPLQKDVSNPYPASHHATSAEVLAPQPPIILFHLESEIHVDSFACEYVLLSPSHLQIYLP